MSVSIPAHERRLVVVNLTVGANEKLGPTEVSLIAWGTRVPGSIDAQSLHVSVLIVGPNGELAQPSSFLESHQVAAGFAGVGATAVILALAFRRESARLRIIGFGIALYTRLRPAQVHDSESRERILTVIRARPGIHYSALQRETRMATGRLLHHLQVLQRNHAITSRSEAGRRRYVLAGSPAVAPLLSTRELALQALANGPLPQRVLAARLGLTRQGANHHVKALERAGLVRLVQGRGEWLVERI
ncbi:MAG: winged helix-turn-helix transcriptional regulator [Candidatus Thermoplasmatota archaeon]